MAIGPGNPPKKNEDPHEMFDISEEDFKEIVEPGHISPTQLRQELSWLVENYPRKNLKQEVRQGGVFDPKRSILEMYRDGDAKSVRASIKAMQGLSDGSYTGGTFYLGGNQDTSFNR